ncbi:MAG: outer membrane beta-barrel protein [Bacteroidetes bacterium]|jgi:hypothetical protein|nr:outer membrane beta-barrel protein [Bacteroidota bacterium]
MKRFFLCLVLAGLVGGATHPLQAQEFGGGALFGANVATLRGGAGDLGYRTAASGGLFVRLRVLDPLSVRSELLFSQKGVKINTDAGELTLKANYLELPVLVVGHLPFLRAYAPHLLAGPALSLKLFERRGAPGFSVDTDEKAFERTDAGIMVGAGASLGGPGALQLEVRYIFGLRDVTQPVTADPLAGTLPGEGRNGVVSIMVKLGM